MRALRNKKALTEHKYYHDSEHILEDFHWWDEVIPIQPSFPFLSISLEVGSSSPFFISRPLNIAKGSGKYCALPQGRGVRT